MFTPSIRQNGLVHSTSSGCDARFPQKLERRENTALCFCEAILKEEAWNDCPTWWAILEGEWPARPKDASTANWPHGWQFQRGADSQPTLPQSRAVAGPPTKLVKRRQRKAYFGKVCKWGAATPETICPGLYSAGRAEVGSTSARQAQSCDNTQRPQACAGHAIRQPTTPRHGRACTAYRGMLIPVTQFSCHR